MDRSPPAFFRQAYSANAKLAFFSLLAITLLFVDSRYDVLSTLRKGVGTALFPVQWALLKPRNAAMASTEYVADVNRLRSENAELRAVELANAKTLLRVEQLAAENAQIRALMGAREQTVTKSIGAEVLYETRDAFTRKFVIDKGQNSQIKLGMPVIDAKGLLGQITRVFPLTAEITVVNDRNAAIPAQVQRTGQRTVAFGGAEGGQIELRYLPANADVKEGDVVATSGLDGVFPAGLPIGKVIKFDRAGAFARALLEPIATVDNTRMLLVLLVDNDALPSRPPLEPASEGKKKVKKP